MKIFLVFGLICFSSINMYAVTRCRDTIPQEKPWKISRQQFLDRYGKDDTGRAIINYYFLRRKKASKGLIPFSLIITGSAILYVTKVANGEAWVVLVWGPITIGLMLVFGTLLVLSFMNLLKFSRKTLLKTLDNYFSAKGIPGDLKKNLYKKRGWY